MNMTNPPESVLTHGGHSEKAMASTIKTHSEVLEAQHKTVVESHRRDTAPERHMHFKESGPVEVMDDGSDWPKVLHHKSKVGVTKEVNDPQEESEAIDAGWCLSPLEKVKDEQGKTRYVKGKEPDHQLSLKEE